MTHLTDVIEEEIFRIIGTNDSPIYKEKRADLTQAMTKAALATQRQLAVWIRHDPQCATEFEAGDCDCGLDKALSTLTK